MQQLGAVARAVRNEYYPQKKVEVRSVIEISNICRQNCKYCNMGDNKSITHYELNKEEITGIVGYLYKLGRRRILLQSGENESDRFIDTVSLAIKEIKKKYDDLVIMLCLGNLKRENYEQLKECGAERYVLKFETSNEKIFAETKPGDTLAKRMSCINDLIDIGYGVGSGNIIGLPGQTIDDIVADLCLIHDLNLTMNSTTVFVPAENSVYADMPSGNVNITLNFMALMRIMNPTRLMPTTSSLEKIKKGGQLLGLNYGANTVTIHDGTPDELKKLFPIYSTKRIKPQKDHFLEIVRNADMSF